MRIEAPSTRPEVQNVKIEAHVRHLMLALAGIVVGLMSVSLLFDLALYRDPQSTEVERYVTQYDHLVRTSFVPIIVVGTLLGLVASTIYFGIIGGRRRRRASHRDRPHLGRLRGGSEAQEAFSAPPLS